MSSIRFDASTEERKMVFSIMFIILVFAATIVIQVYQPFTGGYFNLGESVIYVAALVFGPWVAGIAGGIGAALADAVSGYGIFVPATLIIKFAEGFIAGLLTLKLRKMKINSKIIAIVLGLIYLGLIAIIGSVYLSGSLWAGSEILGYGVEGVIPWWFWVFIGLVVFVTIAYIGLTTRYGGVEPLTLLVAGLVMVFGYFLYEYFISNPLTGREPIAAVFEIPVNIGQAVIGASIALPIVGFLRRAGYVEENYGGQRT